MKPSFTELREHLPVQKKVTQDDGLGGLKEVWQDHPPLWGKVDFASSKDITSRSLRDLVNGASVLRKSIYRVTMRYHKTLPEHLRFKREGKTLHVISSPVHDTAQAGYMILFAVEL